MISGDYLLRRINSYRANYQLLIVATQAAGSRLFEIRNANTQGTQNPRLLMPTRLEISWVQNAAHTAAILAGLEVYKATGFTAVDTADVTTIAGQTMRTTGTTAAPGGALLRGVTASGVAAGMTGGTVTTAGAPLARYRKWMLATVPTAAEVMTNWWLPIPEVRAGEDDSPLLLDENEGLVITNTTLLGAAAGSLVNIDLKWSEVEIAGLRDSMR